MDVLSIRSRARQLLAAAWQRAQVRRRPARDRRRHDARDRGGATQRPDPRRPRDEPRDEAGATTADAPAARSPRRSRRPLRSVDRWPRRDVPGGRGRGARLHQPAPRDRRSWRGCSTRRGTAGDAFGRVRAEEPRHVNVEFVSANPTGPLTVGNARGAFVGDLLCRVLEGGGHGSRASTTSTTRARRFACSARRWRRWRWGAELPEDGLSGRLCRRPRAEVPDDVWEAATAPDGDRDGGPGRLGDRRRVRAGHRGQSRATRRALRRLAE